MGSGAVDEAILQIEAGFAVLAVVEVTALTGEEVRELTTASQRLRSLADAVCVRSAGALDVSRAWAPEGAKSASAWMQWRCRIQKHRGTEHLRSARHLRDMPATEAALLAGAITLDHVRLLVDAKQAAPDAFAADEGRLVEAATSLAVRTFETAIKYWKHRHAPDDAEADAADAFERRKAHVSTTFESTVVVDALLDPIGGAIFARELERIEQRLFEADWAEARARLGDSATKDDLLRTPRQRRADAMVIMAERSAAKPADATEARVLLQVLVGEESLVRTCELSNRHVVTPGQLVPLLTKADIERIVFDGPSKVIDVGVRRRFFTGATRTAVEVRDRECSHPSCHVPAERCQIDHIHPYCAGGLTIQANGEPKCGFHNRLKGGRPPPPAA